MKSFIDLFDLCVDSFSKLFWTILGNVARDAPDVTFHPESRGEVVSVEFEGSEFGSWRTRHCSEVSLTAQASVPGTRQNTGARENEIMGELVRNIENHLLSSLNVLEIGFIIKHQGSLGMEQRLVSKFFFVITNRESRNKMNLRKQVALWRHFESDEAQLMEIGEAISLWKQAWPDNDTPQDSSESRTSRTSQLFLGACHVLNLNGERIEIE